MTRATTNFGDDQKLAKPYKNKYTMTFRTFQFQSDIMVSFELKK